MSEETVAAELAEATAILRELRLDLASVAQRSGTFDHEALAMDKMLERAWMSLVRFQLWLNDVGKETR